MSEAEDCLLRKLFVDGLPPIKMIRVACRATKHTSSHQKVDEVIPMKFKVLNSVANTDLNNSIFNKISACLPRFSDGEVYYSSGVDSSVESFLFDIVKMLNKDLIVLSECSITVENFRENSTERPDLWVVYKDGRPIITIVIKCPDSLPEHVQSEMVPDEEKEAEDQVRKLRAEADRLRLLLAGDMVKCQFHFLGILSVVNQAYKEKLQAPQSDNASKRQRLSYIRKKTSILDNLEVLGQCFDYLTNMKSFHGNECVFGIVTTMKEWRVVGLSGCQNLAESDTLPSVGSTSASSEATDAVSGEAELGDAAPIPPAPVASTARCTRSSSAAAGQSSASADSPTVSPHGNKRVIYASEIYDQTNSSLCKIVMSVIEKALSVPPRPVDLLSVDRRYIQLYEDSWVWTKPSRQEVKTWSAKVSCNLKEVPATGTEFLVLKYLVIKNIAKSWLCMISNTGQAGTLCVIKQMGGDSDLARKKAKHEVLQWKVMVNNCNATTMTLCGSSSDACVVMPMVILARCDENDVAFIFDPYEWFFFVSDDKTDRRNEYPAVMNEFARGMFEICEQNNLLNPWHVAKLAVLNLAVTRHIHEDLEWRHIALIPVFNQNGELDDVMPGLIDFEDVIPYNGSADEFENVIQAHAIMLERLQDLAKDKVFSVVDADGVRTRLS